MPYAEEIKTRVSVYHYILQQIAQFLLHSNSTDDNIRNSKYLSVYTDGVGVIKKRYHKRCLFFIWLPLSDSYGAIKIRVSVYHYILQQIAQFLLRQQQHRRPRLQRNRSAVSSADRQHLTDDNNRAFTYFTPVSTTNSLLNCLLYASTS